GGRDRGGQLAAPAHPKGDPRPDNSDAFRVALVADHRTGAKIVVVTGRYAGRSWASRIFSRAGASGLPWPPARPPPYSWRGAPGLRRCWSAFSAAASRR